MAFCVFGHQTRILGGDKYFGFKRVVLYLVWDTASQSTKVQDILNKIKYGK